MMKGNGFTCCKLQKNKIHQEKDELFSKQLVLTFGDIHLHVCMHGQP